MKRRMKTKIKLILIDLFIKLLEGIMFCLGFVIAIAIIKLVVGL